MLLSRLSTFPNIPTTTGIAVISKMCLCLDTLDVHVRAKPEAVRYVMCIVRCRIRCATKR